MAIDINFTETRGVSVEAFMTVPPRLACFLPICLYSFMANKPFLQEYLPWAVTRGSCIKIIIGDYLERHNIMVFDSISEANAIIKAKKKGDRVHRMIKTILSNVENKNDIQIYSCESDIETDECKKIADNLRTYLETDPSFKFDIEEQTSLMLAGNKRYFLDAIDKGSMLRLSEYMIEELALYIYLYHQGFKTEIYPGKDMKVLQRITTSQYREFPYVLSERTHISVSVGLDGGSSYAQMG